MAHLALISGASLHPQIESVAAFRGGLLVAAGRQHPLAAQPTVTLSDLARAQVLVSYWGPASEAFLERVRAAASEAQAGPWMQLSPVELVKGMLLTGTGVSLVPAIAVQRELEAGDLLSLTVHDGGQPVRLPDWEITLIRHKRRPPNAAADALAETLRRVLPTLPLGRP